MLAIDAQVRAEAVHTAAGHWTFAEKDAQWWCAEGERLWHLSQGAGKRFLTAAADAAYLISSRLQALDNNEAFPKP